MDTVYIVLWGMLKTIRINSLLILAIFLLPTSVLYSAPNLGLSQGERVWLKDHPTVSFTGDPNWLPYEAFDSSGEYIGIVSEHLKIISNLTGIKFEMSPSKTWTESTEKAKKGLVDILSETDDSDLKSHLIFTNNYLSNPIVIAMHNRENYVESIEGIEDRKIALIKDYGYASKIRRKYASIRFITVEDIQDGLIAVSTGKVDALLCTLALCSYTIAELGLNNVRIVGKTEFDTKLALGVQRNLPELVSILNKAINKITPGQQQVILDAWIKQKFMHKTDYTLVYQVMVIAFVLLGIFIVWNRRLSHEVNLRTATEKDLKSAEEVLRISHQRLLLHREQTPLAVIEWNTDFEFVDWNKAAERIFGFTKDEVLGRHVTDRILPESAREAVDIIWRDLLENKGGQRSTNENLTKDGRTILCEWYNTPLVDQDGKVIGVASLVNDVTEKKLSEELIWKQANFDMLTGLPNRNMFHDRLAQEAGKSSRAKLPLALLLIDLDEFKEVNDTLGHDVGDLLLQEAGKRISTCVRETDTVARLGGDEFTIILSELQDKNKVDRIAEKIIGELAEEYHIGDEVIHVSGSIGITLYPHDSSDIDTLIKNADQAMYAAKKKGRNCFSYFTQSLQDAAQNRMHLTNDLRSALTENQFEVYYQPIVDLRTGQIVKAEALLRWHHPERGMVSPLEFIPLAEDTGLINQIGDWVFKESSRRANQWSEQLAGEFQISVNMSPIQFKIENSVFTKEWLDFLQEFDLSGKNIVVEITEGLLLNVEPEVIDKLLWLRDTGIQVAIDDFGTGYSSLSYLRKFDIDYLKIDKSFVRNLEKDNNDIALSEAIIVMAHKLGLKVIAEGVETEAQKKMLIDAGCDYAQGFLYSEAVPSSKFESLLFNQPSLI
jgi:diguanylate cyclase (GGDEF)-like protein/PAS domain S-box-containing protein